MTLRAFELLLAVIETLVFQLKKKGVIDGNDILALVETAKKEARRRPGG